MRANGPRLASGARLTAVKKRGGSAGGRGEGFCFVPRGGAAPGLLGCRVLPTGRLTPSPTPLPPRKPAPPLCPLWGPEGRGGRVWSRLFC